MSKQMFGDELSFLTKVEQNNSRSLSSESDIERIATKYPELSKEYLAYLREVGWGSIRDSQFMVYEEPMTLSDLGLEEDYEVGSNIVFFGDNFSGDLAGFDTRKRKIKVIELWHEDGELFETGQTFRKYIREKMMIGKKGEDLSGL